ncbi:MAG: pyridoxal-dependent decarboxylase [Synechococcaceae cyanobacterium RL_1_2]|nr:pyridoxal-dependent decarboxylase [Synechococcaceae cyanobacterium RL_1_2]
MIGMGTDNLIRVSSDDRGRMLPAALEASIQEQLTHGHQPFFVVATAGTTVLGAFDPIEHIGEITQKYGLWLHIDGAWGGPVAFSDRHRHLLKGSHLGDSFTWDAHKLMGLPLSCSALLVKHRGTLLDTTGDQDNEEQYLFHHEPEYGYDLGMMSLQCGRPADVLKLWFAWQHHGLEGYRDRIDHLYDLAHYCSEFVRHHPDLELITEPTYLNICFRYNPHHAYLPEQTLEQLNLAIRYELMRSGLTMVNYAKVKGKVIIRLVLPNGALQQDDLEQFFNNFLTVAAKQKLNHHQTEI